MFGKIFEGLAYAVAFVVAGVATIFSMWLIYTFFNYFGIFNI